ncbi:MAG TPA: galactokinase [Candidatus Limnocylindrales bacterium]|nr:galactokinase [Candidatus Limnocylindrales bacterium]
MTGASTSVASPRPPDRDELLEALRGIAGPFDPATAVVARAPGRVNLIGEHTDYNEGFALPFAIDLEIRIAAVPADDGRVDLTRLDSGERDGFRIDAVGARRGGWIDYVAGTAWSLAEDGVSLRAVRGVIASTLPASSGLSSSAALELASAWTIAEAPADLDPIRVVRLCQRAENAYVGVRTGIMDQLASAMGRPGAAVLLDCRSLDWRPVALPLERVTPVVVHSGSSRSLDGSAYNERRAQCEAGVEAIARGRPEVRALRDVTPAMLEAAAAELDPVTLRRCRHVVTEDERVLATADALEAGDLEAVGRLLVASHESLRDLYEVSSRELDALVEIATGVSGVYGARMTGAGFGGCIVALVAPEAVERLAEAIRADYPRRTGLEPRIWAVTPVAGAGTV